MSSSLLTGWAQAHAMNCFAKGLMVQGAASRTLHLHKFCQLVMGPFFHSTRLTTISYNILADPTLGCTEFAFPPLLWEASHF